MKKSAIAKIIACSIIGMLLTTVLLSTLACTTIRGTNETIEAIGNKIEEVFDGDVIGNTIDVTVSAIERLPKPKIRLIGCAPIITLERDDDGDGVILSEGVVPSGYTEGSGGYDTVPQKIEIDWASGRIYVISDANWTGVSIYEYDGNVNPLPNGLGDLYAVTGSSRMIHRMDDRTLKIDEFRNGFSLLKNDYPKTLLVLLPNTELEKLDIDVASATIELTDLSCEKLDVDTASGNLTVTGCTIGSADIDAASAKGTVMNSTVERIDIDVASGSLTLSLLNTPDRIEVDAVSGMVEFYLPSDASFIAKVEKMSGRFTLNGFSSTEQNGRTVVGSGDSRFDFRMMSGSVSITANESNELYSPKK